MQTNLKTPLFVEYVYVPTGDTCRKTEPSINYITTEGWSIPGHIVEAPDSKDFKKVEPKHVPMVFINEKYNNIDSMEGETKVNLSVCINNMTDDDLLQLIVKLVMLKSRMDNPAH